MRYIGSGKDVLNSRKSNHWSRLRKNKHCKKLQTLWDEFGEDSFEFVVLEECLIRECFEKEDKFMKEYKDTIVNTNGIRDTKKSKKTGLKAKVHKEHFKEMFSGELNPNCHTEIDVIIAIKTDIAAGLKNKDIVIKYGKSPAYISNIRVGNRWADVVIDNINVIDKNEETTIFEDIAVPFVNGSGNANVEANASLNLV